MMANVNQAIMINDDEQVKRCESAQECEEVDEEASRR
jgi:hypothetical protein